MRSNTSLLGRALLWIALQARHLNENLEKNLQIESVCSVCSGDKNFRAIRVQKFRNFKRKCPRIAGNV